MFRTKNFKEIVSGMLGHARATQTRITDFNVGAVARVMFEAPGAEIDELYQMYAQGLIEGIPTAIYRSFDFPLLPARSASGVLRFSAAADHPAPITVPVGALASSRSGQRYQTAEQGVIQVGQSFVDVLASAVEPGLPGNAAENTIDRRISSISGLSGVTNPQPFSNGAGKETEAERRLRFIEYVKTLAKATPAALRYAARLAEINDPKTGAAVERVVRAVISEGTGHVDLFVHNGGGGTSARLVERTQEIIEGYDDPATGKPVPGWRPAGMRVDVIAMAEISVAVEVGAEVPLSLRSEALRTKIAQSLAATVRSIPNNGRLRPLDLVNAAVALDGVSGAVIEEPTLTVPCPASAVLVPGAITVNWI